MVAPEGLADKCQKLGGSQSLPCGCPKGECSRNSNDAIASTAQWEHGREWQTRSKNLSLGSTTTCRTPLSVVKTGVFPLCEMGAIDQCSTDSTF